MLQLQQIPDWVNDDSVVGELPADKASEAELIRLAAAVIQGDFQQLTWQAFWRTTVVGESSADIARDLQMTANGVRQARFRVLRRLRELLE